MAKLWWPVVFTVLVCLCLCAFVETGAYDPEKETGVAIQRKAEMPSAFIRKTRAVASVVGSGSSHQSPIKRILKNRRGMKKARRVRKRNAIRRARQSWNGTDFGWNYTTPKITLSTPAYNRTTDYDYRYNGWNSGWNETYDDGWNSTYDSDWNDPYDSGLNGTHDYSYADNGTGGGWTVKPTTPRWINDSGGGWTVKPTTPRWINDSGGGWTVKPTTPRWINDSGGGWTVKPTTPRWINDSGWWVTPRSVNQSWVPFNSSAGLLPGLNPAVLACILYGQNCSSLTTTALPRGVTRGQVVTWGDNSNTDAVKDTLAKLKADYERGLISDEAYQRALAVLVGANQPTLVTSSGEGESGEDDKGGIIAGAIVGGLVFVVIVAAFALMVLYKDTVSEMCLRKQREVVYHSHPTRLENPTYGQLRDRDTPSAGVTPQTSAYQEPTYASLDQQARTKEAKAVAEYSDLGYTSASTVPSLPVATTQANAPPFYTVQRPQTSA